MVLSAHLSVSSCAIWAELLGQWDSRAAHQQTVPGHATSSSPSPWADLSLSPGHLFISQLQTVFEAVERCPGLLFVSTELAAGV